MRKLPIRSHFRLPLVTLFLCGCMTMGQTAFSFDYYQPLPVNSMEPEDNPVTQAKVTLGKRLFYDRRLSQDNSLSCNDCHNLLTGGDDDQAFSKGVNGKPTKRSAPGLWNIGLQTVLYWDGRVKTLEEQALDHLSDPDIMGMENMHLLEKRLSNDRGYQKDFKIAFGNTVNATNIAKALASFQRALLAPNSAFDRYISGDKTALSKSAVAGMQEFNDSGCLACHFGTNFAGPAPGPAMKMGDGFYELFPNNLGSPYDNSHNLVKDLGRYEFSKKDNEKYMWRVPSLRNIALTAPYFHNGSAKTLREAVKIMAKTQFNNELSEQQVDNITAFLRSLTGETPAVLK